DEVLFRLYYCYGKTGALSAAAGIKNKMNERFAHSKFTSILNSGKEEDSKAKNSIATKTYENIYELFIEGKFSEALDAKKKADSIYGDNYWSPQLLYIESVYYIR